MLVYVCVCGGVSEIVLVREVDGKVCEMGREFVGNRVGEAKVYVCVCVFFFFFFLGGGERRDGGREREGKRSQKERDIQN